VLKRLRCPPSLACGYPSSGYLDKAQHAALLCENLVPRVPDEVSSSSSAPDEPRRVHHSSGGGGRHYRGGGPRRLFGGMMGGLFRR
jgi:hypothetical protein